MRGWNRSTPMHIDVSREGCACVYMPVQGRCLCASPERDACASAHACMQGGCVCVCMCTRLCTCMHAHPGPRICMQVQRGMCAKCTRTYIGDVRAHVYRYAEDLPLPARGLGAGGQVISTSPSRLQSREEELWLPLPSPKAWGDMHMHADMHTRGNTQGHAHTQTCTRTHTHARNWTRWQWWGEWIREQSPQGRDRHTDTGRGGGASRVPT